MRATDENHIGLAPISGGSLYYEKMGNGPALILLHPGFSDGRIWDLQVESLASQYTVIRYDQRGAGRSSIPRAPFSHVEDLRAILDYLGIPRAYLVGQAVGAQIAIDFSLLYPKRVDSLVLVSPGLSGYSWSDDFLDWIKEVYRDFSVEGITERTLAASFYSVAMQGRLAARRLRVLTRHNVQRLLAWKNHELSWPKPEAIEVLGNLKPPALVIVGQHDNDDVQSIAQLIELKGPHVQLFNQDDADHFPNLVDPPAFNSKVLDFFASTPVRKKKRLA